MRVVFYARAGYESDALFQYLYAHVAAAFPDTHILVARPAPRNGMKHAVRRLRRVLRQRGAAVFVEIVSSKPLQILIGRRHARELEARLNALPRPASTRPVSEVLTDAPNSDAAVEALKALHPDVLIQAGAGILAPRIFTIPRIATINMHHGVAPLIRGMNSIYWALLERKNEWIGATVHRIDAGIDTGEVLGYARVEGRAPGEGFPSLFARATQTATSELVGILRRLEAGETGGVAAAPGRSEYRSSMSGWKLARVELMLLGERLRDRGGRASAPAENEAGSRQQSH